MEGRRRLGSCQWELWGWGGAGAVFLQPHLQGFVDEFVLSPGNGLVPEAAGAFGQRSGVGGVSVQGLG